MKKPRLSIRKRTPTFDTILVFTFFTLISIGLLMVASASVAIAEKQQLMQFYYLLRQGFFLLIALGCSLIIFRLPGSIWQKYGPILFVWALILLIAVLIPGIGREVNGSRRWIGFGPIALQVSEYVKLATIIFMAGYLQRREEEVRSQISGFLKPMALLGLIAGLLLLEPDFGASVVIIMTIIAMMFLAGVRLRQFALLSVVVVTALALIAIAEPYRLTRLTSFLNPWENAFGSGYQLTQSLIAFGRGGWLGVGLGASVQKLFYLPEAHTDFIFAVLAEEMGLIGTIVVLVLFAILVIRILFIGRRCQLQGGAFSAYYCFGIAIWLGIQVVVNIGVATGLLPTKGLTLPFLSYGGSSLLIDCLAIAIVLRIDYESRLKTT